MAEQANRYRLNTLLIHGGLIACPVENKAIGDIVGDFRQALENI